MTEADRQDLLIGLRLSGGINECYRLGSRALGMADELAAQGTRMALAAAHRIRFTYYAVRGMRDKAEEYRRELDIHGLQGGTTWQVEWFAVPIEGIASAMLGDVVGAGQALVRLERLASDIPSLVPLRDMVKIGYHVRRGDQGLAIELGARFVREHPAGSVIGWAAAYAAYAAALNQRERYAEASELCEGALQTLSAEDLEYVIMYGSLVRECVVARAGCGNLSGALQMLDELSEKLRDHGEFALLAHAYEARISMGRTTGDHSGLMEALNGLREAAERAGSSSVTEQAAKVVQSHLRATTDVETTGAEPRNDDACSADATPAGGIARTRRRALLRRLMDHAGARAALVLAYPEPHATPELVLSMGAALAPAALLAALQARADWWGRDENEQLAERLTVAIEGRRFELLRLPRDGQREVPLLLLLERAEKAAEPLPPMLLARLTDEVRAELSFSNQRSSSAASSDPDHGSESSW
jgi:hypothetical protein